MDPGVRTFQTVFDASSSKVIHVGDADMGRIFRLGLEVDKLVAKTTTCSSSRQKYRYRRACMRLKMSRENFLLLITTLLGFLCSKFRRW